VSQVHFLVDSGFELLEGGHVLERVREATVPGCGEHGDEAVVPVGRSLSVARDFSGRLKTLRVEVRELLLVVERVERLGPMKIGVGARL